MSVNGGWTEYNNWSECSVTCGGGSQSRNRSCTKPSPAYGGLKCSGPNTENRVCGTAHCLGKLNEQEQFKGIRLLNNSMDNN